MSLVFGAGLTNRVSCGTDATLNDLTTLTVAGWFYATTRTNLRRLVAKRSSNGGDGWYFGITSSGGNMRFLWTRATASLNYETNDTPLPGSTWTFCVATCDRNTDVARIYTGGLATSAVESTYGTSIGGSGAYDSDAARNFTIGNDSTGNGSISRTFQGNIGPVIAFNRVLTLSEIRQLQFNMQNGVGCVGLWRLGDNGTGTQNDLSGHGNAGTVTGATLANNPPLPRWRRKTWNIPYMTASGSTVQLAGMIRG